MHEPSIVRQRVANKFHGATAIFLDRIGGSVTVIFKGRKTTFPNTRVKPAFLNVGDKLDDDISEKLDKDISEIIDDDVGAKLADDISDRLDDDVGDKLDDGFGDEAQTLECLDTYITDVVKNLHDKRFVNAIKAEMAGLLSRDVFELVSENAVPSGSNIMGSKFHLVMKNTETSQPVYKARLVIFGLRDAEKGHILSEAPTVSQISIRTLISMSVVNERPIWSRDIRQAFIQSESILSRTLYMQNPRQLQASYKGQLMRLKKPLYGITEAPSVVPKLSTA
jgi:Reverse transcriptase (RNA-dependent DNA polymerase)